MLGPPPENLLRSILHTLAYADVFEYPLTVPEVYRYLISTRASLSAVARALADDTLFSKVGEYLTLRGREQIVHTRRRRATIASHLWPAAAHYARIIASLPFVRMVAVTGSLAMNNTEAGTDVDYMIVTAPHHLWTCRALCLLVARLARPRGLILCPNYLLTTNALELKERSLYVAHELAQMIPLAGMETYHELRRLNDWTHDYLPNAVAAPELPAGVMRVEERPSVQNALESLLRLPFLAWFEESEMKRKIAQLTREQSCSSESYFSANVCKGHMDRHGESVATALAIRMHKTK